MSRVSDQQRWFKALRCREIKSNAVSFILLLLGIATHTLFVRCSIIDTSTTDIDVLSGAHE